MEINNSVSGSVKVSVVIPVYNSEDEVERLVGNLKEQTFNSFEVIISNDASTDGTLEKLREAVSDEAHMRVISAEENKGPGAAKNAALDQATGEYILFMDFDDALQSDAIEKLYAKAEAEDADIVGSTIEKIFQDGHKEQFFGFSEETFGKELDEELRAKALVCGNYLLVGRLFRRSIIEENKIRFREAYLMEDSDFFIACLMGAKKVSGISDITYIIRTADDASLTRKNVTDRSVDAVCEVIGATKMLMKEYASKNGPLRQAFTAVIAFQFIQNLENYCIGAFLEEVSVDIILSKMKRLRHAYDTAVLGGSLGSNPYAKAFFTASELNTEYLSKTNMTACLKKILETALEELKEEEAK